MKLILSIVLLLPLLLPYQALAITGDKARFDWSGGKPALTGDNTNLCTGTATARFDWSAGIPSIVFNGTATCTAAGGATTTSSRVTITGGTVIIQKNTTI